MKIKTNISSHTFLILIVTFFLGTSRIKSQSYCDPSHWGATYNNHITNVQIGGINKSHAGGDGQKNDFTGDTDGAMNQGQNYSISFSTNKVAWASYLYVFIDWNDDGDWNDASETIVNGAACGTPSGTYTWTDASYTCPSIATGTVRMRVISSIYSSASHPCYNWDYGEFEDYEIVVSLAGSAPTVTTTAITNEDCSTADGGGNVTADGGDPVTARGVCWNTGGTPTTADSKTTDGSGTGAYSSSITGLTQGTTYYVRAYATNGIGTSYGAQTSFTALSSTTAGSIGSAQTICEGGTPAGLTQTGAAGGGDGSYTYQWQDDDGGWANISGATSSTYSPPALSTSTNYRRQATSSNCGTATSASILITVDPTTVGGSISSAASVCTGSNGATLTLSGHTGNITKWEYSEDNWVTDPDIANTTTTEAYLNLTTTTKYRAIVQSGVCAATNSSDVTITVDPASVGGTIATAATVCSGSNGATLTLSGHTGSVTKWEYSEDNWTTDPDIVNTTTTNAYSNITTTTKYRAVVQSGSCAAANSADVEITVTPALDPGVIKFQ